MGVGMPDGRVVVLAYYFPPLTGIASERAFSLSHHLRDLGWDVVVVTAREGFYHRSPDAAKVSVEVLRTRSLEISRFVRRGYLAGRVMAADESTVSPVKAGTVGRRVRGLVRDFVYVPDAQVGWIPFAVEAGWRALRRWPGPRVIYSTSVPYSAHLAARLIARHTRSGWVAEMRDPWATSASPYRSQNRARRRVDARLEARIVHSCDHVITTTQSLRRELMRIHALDPDRLSVITNGFEPITARAVTPADQPMTILYAGTVSTGENMGPFLSALDGLERRRPGAFRLRVFGPPQPWESPLGSGQPRPWLELLGMVSPARAREAMAESSVMLLVQEHPAYQVVLPGKIFEYIGARRPILAVCPPMTEMLDVMRDYADVWHVAPGDRASLLLALEQLVDEHRAGRLRAPRVARGTVAPLQRGEQARQLSDVLAASAQPPMWRRR